MRNGRAAAQPKEQITLTAKIRDEELEKRVDNKGLQGLGVSGGGGSGGIGVQEWGWRRKWHTS